MLSTAIILLAAVLSRPPELVQTIYQVAPAHPVLHLAVVEAESEFNFHARHLNTDGSVDEGAYQTNSRWHPRFADVDEQLDYGAHNLEVVLFRYPDVRQALSYYNTGSPHRGAAYARRVMRIYRTLLSWLGIEREGGMDVLGLPLFASVGRETQADKVLRMLQDRPAGITARDAMEGIGCFRLAARVHDLRADGYAITSEMVEVPTRNGTARVARYQLRGAA